MALPDILAPTGTSPFLADGHTSEDDSGYSAVEVGTGHARLRRASTILEQTRTVRWLLEADDVPVVEEWFRETLKQGTEAFTAYIRNLGPGMVYQGARWISWEWTMLHLGRAIIEGQILLIGEPQTAPPES